MKNDLLPIEKDILKVINVFNGTKYNYKNLMEWSTSKEQVEKNIKPNEIIYIALGFYVAIKP